MNTTPSSLDDSSSVRLHYIDEKFVATVQNFDFIWVSQWFYPKIPMDLTFEKCEFCEKQDFESVNFVKNEILKM